MKRPSFLFVCLLAGIAVRVAAAKDTIYYVNPSSGDDANTGAKEGQAWKSLSKINSMHFTSGDEVIVAPGLHEETLKPSGEGTLEKPIVIQFCRGARQNRPARGAQNRPIL